MLYNHRYVKLTTFRLEGCCEEFRLENRDSSQIQSELMLGKNATIVNLGVKNNSTNMKKNQFPCI